MLIRASSFWTASAGMPRSVPRSCNKSVMTQRASVFGDLRCQSRVCGSNFQTLCVHRHLLLFLLMLTLPLLRQAEAFPEERQQFVGGPESQLLPCVDLFNPAFEVML